MSVRPAGALGSVDHWSSHGSSGWPISRCVSRWYASYALVSLLNSPSWDVVRVPKSGCSRFTCTRNARRISASGAPIGTPSRLASPSAADRLLPVSLATPTPYLPPPMTSLEKYSAGPMEQKNLLGIAAPDGSSVAARGTGRSLWDGRFITSGENFQLKHASIDAETVGHPSVREVPCAPSEIGLSVPLRQRLSHHSTEPAEASSSGPVDMELAHRRITEAPWDAYFFRAAIRDPLNAQLAGLRRQAPGHERTTN